MSGADKCGQEMGAWVNANMRHSECVQTPAFLVTVWGAIEGVFNHGG